MTILRARLNFHIGGHLLAALSSIMVLMLLTLQPLASRYVVYEEEYHRKLITLQFVAHQRHGIHSRSTWRPKVWYRGH